MPDLQGGIQLNGGFNFGGMGVAGLAGMTGFNIGTGNIPNIIPNYTTPAPDDGNNDQSLVVAGKRVHEDIENDNSQKKKRAAV